MKKWTDFQLLKIQKLHCEETCCFIKNQVKVFYNT